MESWVGLGRKDYSNLGTARIELGTLWSEGRDLTNCTNHARPLIAYKDINFWYILLQYCVFMILYIVLNLYWVNPSSSTNYYKNYYCIIFILLLLRVIPAIHGVTWGVTLQVHHLTDGKSAVYVMPQNIPLVIYTRLLSTHFQHLIHAELHLRNLDKGTAQQIIIADLSY